MRSTGTLAQAMPQLHRLRRRLHAASKPHKRGKEGTRQKHGKEGSRSAAVLALPNASNLSAPLAPPLAPANVSANTTSIPAATARQSGQANATAERELPVIGGSVGKPPANATNAPAERELPVIGGSVGKPPANATNATAERELPVIGGSVATTSAVDASPARAPTALGKDEVVYAPGARHNEDGTMIRFSPALEQRLKQERLKRKEEDAATAAAGKCVVARDPTTVLRWTLGKDKSRVLRISVEKDALEALKALEGEVSLARSLALYLSFSLCTHTHTPSGAQGPRGRGFCCLS